MDLVSVRGIAIKAMFADDHLDRVVFKGGNALNLVYGIGTVSGLFPYK
jgi:hypothetical protein